MAEVFGIVAGAVGVVGVVGQIIQGCSFVSQKLADIRDAPAEARALQMRLSRLHQLMGEFSRVSRAPESEGALLECLEIIEYIQLEMKGSNKQSKRRLKNSMRCLTDTSRMRKWILRLDKAIQLLHLTKSCEVIICGQENASILHHIKVQMEALPKEIAHALDSVMRPMIQSQVENQVSEHLQSDQSNKSSSISQPQTQKPIHDIRYGKKPRKSLPSKDKSLWILNVRHYTRSKSLSHLQADGVQMVDVNGYQILLNIPMYRRYIEIERLSHTSEYSFQTIRSYNIVSWSGPFFAALWKSDLHEVRDLLSRGLASPFDRDDYYGWSAYEWLLSKFRSLCALSRFWQDKYHCQPPDFEKNLEDVFQLISLFAPYLRFQYEAFQFCLDLFGYMLYWGKPQAQIALQNILRVLLSNIDGSSDFNLGKAVIEYTSNSQLLTRDILQSNGIEIEEVMDDHSCELKDHPSLREHSDGSRWFQESDAQMLLDKEAVSLKNFLASSDIADAYVPISSSTYRARPWQLSRGADISNLLRAVCQSPEEYRKDIRTCCLNRLSILFQHGADPLQPLTIAINESSKTSSDYVGQRINTTVYRYAYSIGQENLLEEALLRAGWTEVSIKDLLFEDLYAGVPELFSGLRWMTGQECRAEVLDDICRGHFPEYQDDPDLWYKALELSMYLRQTSFVALASIQQMLLGAMGAYKRNTTPGSWLDEGDNKVIKINEDFHCAWTFCYHKDTSLRWGKWKNSKPTFHSIDVDVQPTPKEDCYCLCHIEL